MKKIFLGALTLFICTTVNIAHSQGLKDKIKNKLSGENSSASKGKIAVPDKTVYTDEYGVSGLYQLYNPWAFIKKDKSRNGKEMEAHTMNLQFDASRKYTRVFLENEYDGDWDALGGEIFEKTVWNSSKLYCSEFRTSITASPSTTVDHRETKVQIMQLEPGVMIIGAFRYNKEAPWVTIDEGNESTINIMAKDSSFFSGKSFDEVKKIATKRAEEVYELYRNARAGNVKIPGLGLTDKELTATAQKFMAQASSSDDAGDWSKQLIYTYITYKDWQITYTNSDKVTPIKRRLGIVGIANSLTQEGKCFYQVGYLQQDWNGSEYGAIFFSGFGGGKTHTTCENAGIYNK